jgi:hypothetical protein
MKRILGVAGLFYGMWNDKTITRFNPYILKLCKGAPLYIEKWTWQDGNGAMHSETGMFCICDSGYHYWPCLVCPFKDRIDESSEKKWSALLNSLRKDVECVFGILKMRFQILKHAS